MQLKCSSTVQRHTLKQEKEARSQGAQQSTEDSLIVGRVDIRLTGDCSAITARCRYRDYMSPETAKLCQPVTSSRNVDRYVLLRWHRGLHSQIGVNIAPHSLRLRNLANVLTRLTIYFQTATIPGLVNSCAQGATQA